MIMSWKSKHNKDDDYDYNIVDIAWHEYQSTTKIMIMKIVMTWHGYLSTTNNSKVVGMTWISKHNKDDYYNNKVVGMVWY